MDLVAQSSATQRAQLFETAGARHEPHMDAAILGLLDAAAHL